VNSLAFHTNGDGEQNVRRLVHAGMLEVHLRAGRERSGLGGNKSEFLINGLK